MLDLAARSRFGRLREMRRLGHLRKGWMVVIGGHLEKLGGRYRNGVSSLFLYLLHIGAWTVQEKKQIRVGGSAESPTLSRSLPVSWCR